MINYINPEHFENTSTSVLKEYKKEIEEELSLKEHDSLKSKLWRAKIEVIKELSYRIKK